MTITSDNQCTIKEIGDLFSEDERILRVDFIET